MIYPLLEGSDPWWATLLFMFLMLLGVGVIGTFEVLLCWHKVEKYSDLRDVWMMMGTLAGITLCLWPATTVLIILLMVVYAFRIRNNAHVFFKNLDEIAGYRRKRDKE